jgi:hypothetical protein
MFKFCYWLTAFVLLFFLPGVSIIMLVLYGCFFYMSALISPALRRNGLMQGGQDDSESGPNDQEVVPVSLHTVKANAEHYAAQLNALELERQQPKD